jgi:hypothetical protein
MFLWVTLLATLSLAHSSSVSWTMYVNSSSVSNAIPCGLNTSAACPSIAAAYNTLGVLSNSSYDEAVINLFPGVHNACNISYYAQVSRGRSNITSKITIQAFNSTLGASLVCSDKTVNRMLNVDGKSFGLTVKNVLFSIGTNMTGIRFDTFVAGQEMLSGNLSCVGCTFLGLTAVNNSGIYLNDMLSGFNISFNLFISDCNFTRMFQGVVLRENARVKLQIWTYLHASYVGLALIQKSTFVSNALAIRTGPDVITTITNSSFVSSTSIHIRGFPWSTQYVYDSFFSGQGMLYYERTTNDFIGCTFSDIKSTMAMFAVVISFRNTLFQNSAITTGLVHVAMNLDQLFSFSLIDCFFSNLNSGIYDIIVTLLWIESNPIYRKKVHIYPQFPVSTSLI